MDDVALRVGLEIGFADAIATLQTYQWSRPFHGATPGGDFTRRVSEPAAAWGALHLDSMIPRRPAVLSLCVPPDPSRSLREWILGRSRAYLLLASRGSGLERDRFLVVVFDAEQELLTASCRARLAEERWFRRSTGHAATS